MNLMSIVPGSQKRSRSCISCPSELREVHHQFQICNTGPCSLCTLSVAPIIRTLRVDQSFGLE